MSVHVAIALTTRLFAVTLLLQAVEMFWVTRSRVFKTVWAYDIVKGDLEAGLGVPKRLLRSLFGPRGFSAIVIAQIIGAIAALLFAFTSHDRFCGFCFAALFIIHFLVCVRFRGSYNGGSDMMTFVILTGTLIMTLAPTEALQRLGCLYIGVNAIYSYVKAGFVKAREGGWRDGSFLPIFLSQSLFPDTRRLGIVLRFKPRFSRALTWSLLIFEMGLIATPFLSRAVYFYFAVAVVFHFGIYRAFGLNRFFWIWLCAWPSIIYLGTFARV